MEGRETRVYQGTACGKNMGEVPSFLTLLYLTLPDGREWVRPNREVDRGGRRRPNAPSTGTSTEVDSGQWTAGALPDQTAQHCTAQYASTL